ncbi:MAG: GAF domain-containing protein [Alphaproteobacteria bacterium]|nr:GAF domain-containing protein [Alphaproteobacteria bacterium]
MEPQQPGADSTTETDERLSALVAAMERVSTGAFDTRLPAEADSSGLFEAFNAMAATLGGEAKMLETVKDIAGEINLDTLLQRIIAAATDLLDAKRSSLFLFDVKTSELFSRVAEGVRVKELRFACDEGIAGHVFTTGVGERVKNVYDDRRFNPLIDRETGFRTTSLLCMPIRDKSGTTIGVVQVLNKREGEFNDRDESRLDAFTTQLSLALQNAHLFEDVNNAKVFNDNILKSLNSGLATFGDDGRVTSANDAVARIFGQPVAWFIGKNVADIFGSVGQGQLVTRILEAGDSSSSDAIADRELIKATAPEFRST